MAVSFIAKVLTVQWPQLRPTSASTSAGRVDHLYFFLTGLTLFFTFLIFAIIFYFMIKYRRRSEEERPPETKQSIALEITWIAIPTLICSVIFFWGASLFFADDYALVADSKRERFPVLSESLLDAMATGRTMSLRFDLVSERQGHPAAFDGEAVIDLQRGRGGQAVDAVRRCAALAVDNFLGIARAGD